MPSSCRCRRWRCRRRRPSVAVVVVALSSSSRVFLLGAGLLASVASSSLPRPPHSLSYLAHRRFGTQGVPYNYAYMPLYVYFSDVRNILYVIMLWCFCLIFCVIQRVSHATAVLSPQHNSPRFRHLGAPTAWYTWGAILPECLCDLLRVRHTIFFRTIAVYTFRVFLTQFIRHRRAINYSSYGRSHISIPVIAT